MEMRLMLIVVVILAILANLAKNACSPLIATLAYVTTRQHISVVVLGST